MLKEINDLVISGQLRSVVARRVPLKLNPIRDALSELAAGHVDGKIEVMMHPNFPTPFEMVHI